MTVVSPPRIDSLYNKIVRRLRAAGTIFGDRVKLVLSKPENSLWAKLEKPYLLVIPGQTRAPRDSGANEYQWIDNPRVVQFVAQFDGQGSEAGYLAANDIDTAEQQLIYVLANWTPIADRTAFNPTQYGGMRIMAERAPNVQVMFQFVFTETVRLPLPAPAFLPEEQWIDNPLSQALEGITINVMTPGCDEFCEPDVEMPKVCVTSGQRCEQEQPDCEPPCPPILEQKS